MIIHVCVRIGSQLSLFPHILTSSYPASVVGIPPPPSSSSSRHYQYHPHFWLFSFVRSSFPLPGPFSPPPQLDTIPFHMSRLLDFIPTSHRCPTPRFQFKPASGSKSMPLSLSFLFLFRLIFSRVFVSVFVRV